MKFYLVANKTIELKAPFNQNKNFLVSPSITSHPDNNGNQKEVTDFNKFKRTFYQKYGNLQESSSLAINFHLRCTSPPVNQAWNISIQGDILRAVHEVLCCGSANEALEIVMTVKLTDVQGNPIPQGLSNVTEFFPDADSDGAKVGTFTKYVCSDVKIPVIDTRRYPNQKGQVWVRIEKQNFICIADIIPPFSETNRKILENKKFWDFQILTKDINGDPNEPIFCHKIFLCSNSSVFATMLESEFGEASENKIEIDEISFDGIEALLKFLYYSDVTDALKSSAIALELLKAADKYDIPILWKVICVILLEEPHAWYDVDMALGLFQFLRNKESDEDNKTLLKKVIQVLALKPEQLLKSKLYGEIFRSPMSREMFHLALDTNKP